MKAVIMAGGEGSRLRPLTCDIPKPMARLLGRPVLEYILELLELHDVKRAALTLRYLPDRITERFPTGEYRGLELDFVEENEPLGTAGSVKNACGDGNCDETLVISGDAMCDFDLTAMAEFHRETKADVTIAAKRVEDPREYGLIDAEPGGRIAAFIEKPAFSQAVSDLANTGIYILSERAIKLIPDGVTYDFAKDLFPLMLERGMKLMCWEGAGYWCDIGDLETYIQCQRDMLKGLVKCDIHGGRGENGSVYAGEPPPRGSVFFPPVYIGRDVRIGEGVRIEAGSVIDDGCFIDKNARITSSVLLQNSFISRRARITGALVCDGASIKSGAMLFEGAVVGAGATVGEKSIVNAGIKIWNNKSVPDSVIVAEHVKLGGAGRGFFDDYGITGQIGVELTPEFMARVGCAVGSLSPGSRIALGCSNHQSAQVLAAAAAAGIRSTGSTVVDFGSNFQAQFEFSMNYCSLNLGLFIKGDNRAAARLMTLGGLPADRATERGVETALSRGEFVRSAWDSMGDYVDMEGVGAMYRSQLLRFAPRGLHGCRVKLRSGNQAVQKTLAAAFSQLGCAGDGGFTVEVSSQGDKARVFDQELGYIPHHKIFAWCAISQMEAGNDIAVPFDAPRLLESYAEALNTRILRYLSCPADSSDREARRLAKVQMWSRDGLMQAVMLLNLVRRAGGLRELVAASPGFDREVRTITVGGNPAALIQNLGARRSSRITEGVLLELDKGTALVKPLKRGAGIRIMAESARAEIAAELCDDIEKLLGG